MSLSLDEVRKVATLARLDLSADDLARLRPQLAAILDYVDLLRELDTDGVEPLAHPLPVQNVFRDDEPAPSLPVDESLRNAPARAGNYFGVPAVFDTDSGHENRFTTEGAEGTERRTENVFSPCPLRPLW